MYLKAVCKYAEVYAYVRGSIRRGKKSGLEVGRPQGDPSFTF